MLIEDSLKTDPIRRLNPSLPVELPGSTSVSQAVTKMRELKIGCLLVTNDGRLTGIFTERDLLLKVMAADGSLEDPVSEHMTANPVTIQETASISEAILMMLTGGYRNVPVVSAAGKATGIISVKQITEYIVEHYPEEIYNLPPDPDQVSAEDGGA